MQAGNFVKDDVWHALIVVITNAPNLHGYTVRSLYKAVKTAVEQVYSSRGRISLPIILIIVYCIVPHGLMKLCNFSVRKHLFE